MKIIRYVVVAGILVVGFSIWFAPASLLRHITGDIPGLDVVNTSGSLWNGRGTIVLQGEGVGNLVWKLQPSRFLSLEIGYAFDFDGRDTELHGTFNAGASGLSLDAKGTFGNQSVDYTLARYGISMTGDVLVDHIRSLWAAGEVKSLEGLLAWNGGTVSWNTSTAANTATLPPLQARLEGAAGALNGVIVPADGQAPLLQGSLTSDGTLHVGMTKLLTRLLGIPLQGSDPDHAIVMEMTEDVF